MSGLRIRAVQYGNSTTPANNFVLKTPDIPDQTLRLYRGSLESLGAQVLAITSDNKLTASLNGNADTVTNGVYTTGNQSVGGVKTFTNSPTISTGSDSLLTINGNATTNYAYLSFTQAAAIRWNLVVSPTSSNFTIDRHIAGTWQNSPLTITNSNGDVTLNSTGMGWTYVKNKVVIGPTASYMANGDTSNSLELQNNGGSGDGNMAMMAFHCTGAYLMKFGLRPDGYIGMGGANRAAWSWYSAPGGDMTAAGNIIAYSDPSLKENFERVKDPLAIIRALDGGTFNWKHGIPHVEIKAGKKDYGILADQVERVMPEIVGESISIDGKTYKMVAYDKLVPVLIEAVKKLEDRIIELESK